MTAKTDILLKEYEACQSHNNSIGNQTWISISIIITVNLLLLGQIVTEIVLKSVSITECVQLVLVILLGLAMIFILGIFWRWYNRVTFQMLINRERMRDIETALGMWKNWRVRGMDLEHKLKRLGGQECEEEDKRDLATLFPNQRDYIKHLYKRYIGRYKRPTTEGFPKFNCIFPLLSLLWVGVMILEICI